MYRYIRLLVRYTIDDIFVYRIHYSGVDVKPLTSHPSE